nr:hypothetical protein [uncultured Shimia sp.]
MDKREWKEGKTLSRELRRDTPPELLEQRIPVKCLAYLQEDYPVHQGTAKEGTDRSGQGQLRRPRCKGNRTTRIRASEDLQGWFAKAKFDRHDIGRAEGEEVIVLKNDKNKQIEYEVTPETNRWREELQAYNDLIAGSFIDLPSLQKPILKISKDLAPGSSGDDGLRRIRIGDANKRTRRIFSLSSWDLHGRLYGGRWQQIDSEPTIEADFEGMHVAMIYAEAGLELTHDPYLVEGLRSKGLPPKALRKMAKRLVLAAINAKEKSSAYKAFRESFSPGNAGKSFTDDELEELLRFVLVRNPCLGDYLFSDQGIRLMRKYSETTALIHNHFTQKDIPVLSVHDSDIVDCWHVGELRQVMLDTSEEVTGRPLRMSYNIPGREEFEDVEETALQKHVHDLRWAVYDNRLRGLCAEDAAVSGADLADCQSLRDGRLRGNRQKRPKGAVGQMPKRCVAAFPKLPFDTLCSIFVGQRAALRTKQAFAECARTSALKRLLRRFIYILYC